MSPAQKPLDNGQVRASIAYCGLICDLCHLAAQCPGCKSDGTTCAKHLSPEGCFQRSCCLERGFRGCWECEDFPCDRDMYAADQDPKVRAMARYIREHGAGELVAGVLANREKGLDIRMGGDYDHRTEEEVLLLLGGPDP